MGDSKQAITMCMSCGGDFLLDPADPCTKCHKIQSAGSVAEQEAVIVSVATCIADGFQQNGITIGIN